MGRKRVFREEQTTSITVFQADAYLVEKFQKKGETRADSVRAIFLKQFGKEMIEEAKDEIAKKLDRQALLKLEAGDQTTIISTETGHTIKDILWKRNELLDIVIEGKNLTGELAKRNADDSICRAISRGDVIVESGKYQLVRKWW